MKTWLLESLQFTLKNWRTSLLGLLVLTACLLWLLKELSTDDLLKVMGFCSAVGLFAMKDSPLQPHKLAPELPFGSSLKGEGKKTDDHA
jgi:CBS-domain-containing membrane protein